MSIKSRKPFVVCILDGFGLEEEKSFPIYSKELMPTLDTLSNRYLFSSIGVSGKSVGMSESSAANNEIGYLNFGSGCIVKQSTIITNSHIQDGSFITNNNILGLINHVINNNSKMHIITFIGDKYGEEAITHLKELLYLSTSKNVNNIYLHLYLGNNNNALSNTALNYMPLIHRILNTMPNVHLGVVSGVNYIKDSSGITITKELYKVSFNGIGERWVNYLDGINSNYKRNNLEENLVPFIVSNEGLIAENDGVFIFNYDTSFGSVYTDLMVDPKKYMYTTTEQTNINVVSLFPLNNKTSKYAFNYDKVNTSFYGCLNDCDKKHLLVATSDKIPYLNYYLNGCNSNQATQFVSINPSDNKDYDTSMRENIDSITDKVLEAISGNFYDLIVCNYPIIDYSKDRKTTNIKNALSCFDKNLDKLYKSVIERDGTLIVMSSYGINEILHNEKEESVHVNFSRKVPLIFIDNQLSIDKYSIVSGNISDIGVTILDFMDVPVKGMTGNNLLVSKGVRGKKSGKKGKKSLILIILIFVILIAVGAFALYYLGYI